MKLIFILFAFFINFSTVLVIKAEEIIDPSNILKIHVVKIGDTISSISQKYSIDKELLIKFNNLKDENYIFVGQNLKLSENNYQLPQNIENNLSEGSFHIVQEGETLTEISNKYGLNIKEIIEINNLKDPDAIEQGSNLVLKRKKLINQETIEEKELNSLKKSNINIYGPLSVQQNTLDKSNGREILNALNQKNRKIIISIKCESKELDVRFPGRKWKGWEPAKEEFEKKIINDFC